MAHASLNPSPFESELSLRSSVRHSVAAALLVAANACGGSAPPPKPVVAAAPVEFPLDVKMPRFHSTRFSVSLPLPDGRDWRIDDHKAPLLRATHPPTSSLVELVVWREDKLQNRAMCEARARELGYVADVEADTLESPVESVPEGWDTRLWAGVESNPNAPRVTAHLMVFGAQMKKCLYFHFATTAPRDQPDVISQRLAFARVRILREMRLDSIDVVPREKPNLERSP